MVASGLTSRAMNADGEQFRSACAQRNGLRASGCASSLSERASIPRVFSSENESGYYVSATGRMVVGLPLHPSTKAAETCHGLRMESLPREMDSCEPWQQATVGCGKRCVAPIRGDPIRSRACTKTIVNVAGGEEQVGALAVNEEGDQIYPRTWNHEFIQLPLVVKEQQNRPTIPQAEISAVLGRVKKRCAVLFALIAGTGLRIGEAVAGRRADRSPARRAPPAPPTHSPRSRAAPGSHY